MPAAIPLPGAAGYMGLSNRDFPVFRKLTSTGNGLCSGH